MKPRRSTGAILKVLRQEVANEEREREERERERERESEVPERRSSRKARK
jgi:hypothetical protein